MISGNSQYLSMNRADCLKEHATTLSKAAPLSSLSYIGKVKVKVTHSDPMDCILGWVVIPFSRGSSQPRGWTHVSCIGRWIFFLNHWATREASVCEILCNFIACIDSCYHQSNRYRVFPLFTSLYLYPPLTSSTPWFSSLFPGKCCSVSITIMLPVWECFINGILLWVIFWEGHFSLSIMLLRSNQVDNCINSSLLVITEEYYVVWMYIF